MEKRLNKIPFGLRASDNRFVDVADVDKGKACGCVCPSCSTALVAKHGRVNQWHFAHYFQGSEPGDACEYSFFASVVHMSKQILSEGGMLSLPELVVSKVKAVPRLGGFSSSITATKASTIRVENGLIDPKLGNMKFDVGFNVSDWFLYIMLLCPGHTGLDLNQMGELVGKIGVLEIDLEPAESAYRESKGRFSDWLRDYLLDYVKSKSWIYHPRKQAAEIQAELDLGRQIAKVQNALGGAIACVSDAGAATEKYHCVMCKFDYDGEVLGENPCPKCKSYMFRVKRTAMQ